MGCIVVCTLYRETETTSFSPIHAESIATTFPPTFKTNLSRRAIALCTYLSAVLLVGLVLNSLFNWSWADPSAALVIAAIAVREGVNAWKGDPCCCTPSIGQSSDAVATCDCCSEDDGPCSC